MLCLGVFMETRQNDAILAEEQEESRLNTCRQKPTLKCSLGRSVSSKVLVSYRWSRACWAQKARLRRRG
jgi:hypothetical protein